MANIYIEYQEHGKFNAKALMFLMDLSGIKYEWKVVPSFGYGNFAHPHGIRMTWDGKELHHPATIARLIARESGLESETASLMLAQVKNIKKAKL